MRAGVKKAAGWTAADREMTSPHEEAVAAGIR